MNRILIFDTEISGHHIEYIHHLLVKARADTAEYVFCLPEQFEQVKGDEMDWSYGANVSFSFFDSNLNAGRSSLFASSYRKCRLLKQAINRFDVTHVFLITLMAFIPFLPFFVSSHIKVSGIIYQIYLYRWKSSSFLLKLSDVCKYQILSRSKCISQVYMLNDAASARRLNRLYRTNKFRFLVDPYIPLSESRVDITSLGVKDGNRVYLHFGSLSERKGSLEILKAIKIADADCMNRSTFVFAGKVDNSIRDEFYRMLEYIRENKSCQIIVLDKFCDYGLIGELCKRADVLLMPYKAVSQSSGVIGYAAQYRTPVVAPAKGMIGKLVKKYNLGYLIDGAESAELAAFFNVGPKKQCEVSTQYIQTSTVESFINAIQF